MTTQTLTVAYYTVQSGTGSCPFNTTKTVSGTTYVGVSTTDGNGNYYYFYPALESIDSTQARDTIDTTSLSGGTWQTVYGLGDGTTSSSPTSSSNGYIQSSGSQYIDTGLKGTNGINIKFQYLDSYEIDKSIYGARDSYVRDRFSFMSYSTSFYIMPAGTSIVSYDTNAHYMTFGSNYNWVCNFDGTDVYTSTTTTYSSNCNTYLFAEYTVDKINYQIGNARLYYCTLYTGSTLQRNFIPIQIGTSGEYALYDISFKDNGNTKVIYTNDGSGSFTGGGTQSALTYTHTYQPTVHVYTGSEWVEGIPYVYDGTDWKQAEHVHVYDGTAWVEKT